MRLITDWLCWYFGISGVVCVEESGKLSWFEAFKRLLSGAVVRMSNGPDSQLVAKWAIFGKRLERYHCKVCGVCFWGWKKRKVCYKWSCYRRRNEKSSLHRDIRVVSEKRTK